MHLQQASCTSFGSNITTVLADNSACFDTKKGKIIAENNYKYH